LCCDPLAATASEEPVHDADDANLRGVGLGGIESQFRRPAARLGDKVDPGFFSSSERLRLLPGSLFEQSERRGYYIDLRAKATPTPTWPPRWLRPGYAHVKLAQFGLGHFENFAANGDEQGLSVARSVGDYFVATQVRTDGAHLGGWRHEFSYAFRAPLHPPWLSAMSQGQAASLLTRIFATTGDARYAEAAELALRPMRISVEAGGVLGTIEGRPFLEEYPTSPQSHVLNGAIFALWGLRDVALMTRDAETEKLHSELVSALGATCPCWDTGSWSRYDLFPRRPKNVSSTFYHQLHISQLKVLETLYGGSVFGNLAGRFERYQAGAILRRAAFVQKVAYRLVVPRHKIYKDTPSGRRASARRRVLLKVSRSIPIRRP
jgi:heparosan-N-sulfate-glucuronate 5-epimerase